MSAPRPVLLVTAAVLLCCFATLGHAGFWGCNKGKFNIGHCIKQEDLGWGTIVTYDDWIGGGQTDANCDSICSGTLGRYYKGGCCSLRGECWCY